MTQKIYPVPTSIDETLELLAAANYLADRSLATVLFLALKMGRPIFLEGEAGVGKTEIAKVLAENSLANAASISGIRNTEGPAPVTATRTSPSFILATNTPTMA